MKIASPMVQSQLRAKGFQNKRDNIRSGCKKSGVSKGEPIQQGARKETGEPNPLA